MFLYDKIANVCVSLADVKELKFHDEYNKVQVIFHNMESLVFSANLRILTIATEIPEKATHFKMHHKEKKLPKTS
jgi:hypothetical protein